MPEIRRINKKYCVFCPTKILALVDPGLFSQSGDISPDMLRAYKRQRGSFATPRRGKKITHEPTAAQDKSHSSPKERRKSYPTKHDRKRTSQRIPRKEKNRHQPLKTRHGALGQLFSHNERQLATNRKCTQYSDRCI